LTEDDDHEARNQVREAQGVAHDPATSYMIMLLHIDLIASADFEGERE
jgi:hypothetical protein